MDPRNDEPRATVLPYRPAGAARDTDGPPASPWLVTSWAAFGGALLLVVGGAGWLYASSPSDRYGNGIVYAVAVAIGGLLSFACLLGTSLALLLNRGRRETTIALIAWVLTVLTCATPLVIALLR